MRIAHFYDGIYLNGGVNSYIMALSELQVRAGHEIFFFEECKTSGLLESASVMVIRDNDELFRVCMELEIDVLHMHSALTRRPPNNLNVVFTVHQHKPHCISGGLYLKRRDMPCPRIYSLSGCIHGHVIDHCGSVRPARFLESLLRTITLQRVLPKVTVVSVGQFLRERMIKAGYDSEKVHFVPNFTSFPTVLAPKSESDIPQFLFLGRLEPSKGVSWLLKSFAHMSNAAVLNIAGSGSEERRLIEITREIGIMEKVNFLGWVDSEKRLQLLRNARALVVPSTWHETFGLVVIEAAAQECPVIVSDAGELPFLVADGETGLVVPVGNVTALTMALDQLAGNQARAVVMGSANRQKCQSKYNPEAHMKKIDQIYRVSLGSAVAAQL